jgi:succinoglycan biosynthesis transport protein ExoP
MAPSAPPFENGAIPHSLRDLLTTVFKRRLLILAVLFTVVVVVTIIGLLKPRTYRVAATLLVHAARAEMPIAPTDSTQLIVNRVSEQDLNSEIEVLQGRKLIEDAVRTLYEEDTLTAVPPSVSIEASEPATSPGGDAEQKANFNAVVSLVQANLEVYQVRKSNLLGVGYTSTDPVWATRVVGKLTDEYLKQRSQRYQSPQALAFFEQQMRDAETRLKRHEQALEDFAEEASITIVGGSDGSDSLAAQKGIVMQRLAGLESSLGSAEVDLESQARQVASLRTTLLREPERLESPGNIDASTEEIERALTSLRLQRDALLQDFKPDSRHVRDIDTQIKMAEDRLQHARGTSSVSGTEANPLYLQLKADLLREEAALEGTRSRVGSLRKQVSEGRRDLESLNSKAFDIESLQRDAQAAEADYMLFRKKHEEARISAAMDQEQIVNVSIAQPAQMPLAPEPRGIALRFVLSVFLGLLGGVGLAFVQEMFLDRSFTTAEDLEKRLGIPHMASIPDGEVVGY